MLFDSKNEGACLLYDGISGQSIAGVNPIRTIQNLNDAKMAMGYLAYPNPTLKNEIPDRFFYEYEDIVHDSSEKPTTDSSYSTSGAMEQSFSKPDYIEKIKRIKELLAAGEVYQINFALRFRKSFSGDPYALFCKLAEVNPVSFSAYFNAGDFQIVSSSPERLFKVEDGVITTQPIKGTIAKTRNSKLETRNAEDPNLKKLLNSEKERAELDMITDLERNDVGKICEYGTLKLTKEREVMELKNLLHTYSEVQGKLSSTIKPEQVIEAMFPGGSITGCPKKRAMRYIEELEGLPRNVYTGSIGYIKSASASLKCEMDFNIAIRTVLIKDGRLEFWAGGGIVADSDPEAEYAEALLKADNFLAIM